MAQTEFPVAWDSVCRSAIALCLSGVYVLLAMITFYLFSHRSASGTSGRVVFMCAIAVMLFLALTEIALRLASIALSIQLLYSKIPDSTAGTISSSAQAALQHAYNTAGFVADLILITNNLFVYRCYVISVGYVTVYRNDVSNSGGHSMDSRAGFAFAIVTDFLLTGLTAGRIWWTRREMRRLGEAKFERRYTTAISVLIESGAAYCLFMVLILLALSVGRTAATGPTATLVSLSYEAAGQLANIVPTVFIIRVCLARNCDSSFRKP